MEAVYITLGHEAKEIIWIKRFVNKLELKVTETITLHGDNLMSIALIKDAESQ